MGQKSRQRAASSVEKDFYRLLNNSNFGIDCRKNIDNCYLEPLYDDFSEMSYIKNFTAIFNDDTFRNFFSPCLLRQEIRTTYDSKLFALNKEEPAYETHKNYYERQNAEELDAFDSYEKNKKVKKRKFKNIDEKIRDSLDPRKTKMILDFKHRESGIKSFAIKKKNPIKVTSRFTSGKLLFATLSLKSFIYSIAEISSFPSEIVQAIYKKYQIERILVNHVLTDTDSTAIQFIIVSDPNSDVPEPKMRDIIFEVIIAMKYIYNRCDTSHEFWDNFQARKKNRKKKLGLYETENIDNPCYVTLAVNPKEYFEVFKNYKTNKKHKGIKKGS